MMMSRRIEKKHETEHPLGRDPLCKNECKVLESK
jgi:hypothetical protein